MIDFSTLKGLSIPEGIVTQVADASGRVIWAAQKSKTAVLQVEKITSNTYAGETLYEGEQFILLDIYPNNANSTVKVTYGGLTKTLEFSGTNAQKVYFGTFYGVSDDVETPASGILTIEGEYNAFGTGSFSKSNKLNTAHCSCITGITEWGSITNIPNYAFYECSLLTSIIIPDSVTSIGDYAFNGCDSLTSITIGNGVTSIGNYSFQYCQSIKTLIIGNSVITIGEYAFMQNGEMFGVLNSITLPRTITSLGKWCLATDTSVNALSWRLSKELVILAETPPQIAFDADQNYSSSIGYPNPAPNIIVPKGFGEVYKTANGWSVYADYIVEATE